MKLTITLFLCLTSWLASSQAASENQETMNNYLLHGSFTTKAGKADELADILVEASNLVATAKGCKLYVVSKDRNDPNSVYVTEIWESKEDHDNSLNIEGVRELIGKAMPLLDGPPTKGQELLIFGGTGIE